MIKQAEARQAEIEFYDSRRFAKKIYWKNLKLVTRRDLVKDLNMYQIMFLDYMDLADNNYKLAKEYFETLDITEVYEGILSKTINEYRQYIQ